MSAKLNDLLESASALAAQLLVEQRRHEVRKAKAEADQAELTFEAVKRSIARTELQQEVELSRKGFNLQKNCPCERAGITSRELTGPCATCPKRGS